MKQNRFLKRSFDVMVSLFGLSICMPLLIVIAVFVFIDSGRPVFYTQFRIGRFGRPFLIYKFRSMVRGSGAGPCITIGGDSRVTTVGRYLRKWKLDELPQLLNVLMGSMSVVGPRPEVEKYVCLYNDRQREVLDLIPGITDFASIVFRDEEGVLAGVKNPEEYYINICMDRKIVLNLKYASVASLLNDFLIVVITLLAVLDHKVAVAVLRKIGVVGEK